MSPVVIPFAYSEMMFPDSPSRRRTCLGTVAGSNVPQPIPRHLHLDLADLGRHRLRTRPVAVVARPAPLDRVRLIAEMLGQLHIQPSLQHLAYHRRQPTVVTGQLNPFRSGAGDELLSPLAHPPDSATTGTPRETGISPPPSSVLLEAIEVILSAPPLPAADAQNTPLTQ